MVILHDGPSENIEPILITTRPAQGTYYIAV